MLSAVFHMLLSAWSFRLSPEMLQGRVTSFSWLLSHPHLMALCNNDRSFLPSHSLTWYWGDWFTVQVVLASFPSVMSWGRHLVPSLAHMGNFIWKLALSAISCILQSKSAKWWSYSSHRWGMWGRGLGEVEKPAQPTCLVEAKPETGLGFFSWSKTSCFLLPFSLT